MVFYGYSSFLRYDIIEILLKVALNNHTPNPNYMIYKYSCLKLGLWLFVSTFCNICVLSRGLDSLTEETKNTRESCIMARTSYILSDNDHVRFVLDQQA